MREIKFRGYNPKTNKMATPFYEINADGTWSVVNWHELAGADNATSAIRGIIVTQYTGVKDTNDVEIYEGDIVLSEWGSKEVIEYWRNGFYFRGMLHTNWSTDNVTVIGNIYENPELVEE